MAYANVFYFDESEQE